MNLGFSIRYKFLLVVSALLFACVAIYLSLAVHVFKNDKTELVYDLHRSQVTNLANEIENQFSTLADKFRLFALLSSQGKKELVEEIFRGESDAVYVALIRPSNGEIMKSHFDEKYLQLYGLSFSDFQDLAMAKEKIPTAQILKEEEAFWRPHEKLPLLGFGRRILISGEDGKIVDQWVVVGFVKLDRWLKSISQIQWSKVLFQDQKGNSLFGSLDQSPALISIQRQLFTQAEKIQVKTGVLKIKTSDSEALGAFSKARSGKIQIFAVALEDQAFAAVKHFVTQSMIFSLMILTLGLIAGLAFSRHLTAPLKMLVERMQKVSAGDLSSEIQIHSKDETKILANSFNQMINDLRQSRDELEEINRDLDHKVQERTMQLEEQNRKIKEVQETLIHTTRLASLGELAGRTAHEILNPLTAILARLGLMEKRLKTDVVGQVEFNRELSQTWQKEVADHGFQALVSSWQTPSQVLPGKNLWQEDMQNLNSVNQGLSAGVSELIRDSQFLSHEGGRISKIVDGMRVLSRSHADLKPYSVHQLLEVGTHIMADLYFQESCQIRFDFKASLDSCVLDRDEFTQVVTNLLRNSLQAIKDRRLHQGKNAISLKGEVLIRTELRHSILVIAFEDNGSGIRKEYQAQLFNSQFTTKSPEEGTGLGLGISRRFVRGYGGDLVMSHSEVNQGSCFEIHLPLAIAKSQSEAA